jgi:hypothetical protein
MLGKTKMFTFRGTASKDFKVEFNFEHFYHQMRMKSFVPVAGSEDVVYTGNHRSVGNSRDYVVKIVGQDCDAPWDVRHVTRDGELSWFTTDETQSSLSLTVSG